MDTRCSAFALLLGLALRGNIARGQELPSHEFATLSGRVVSGVNLQPPIAAFALLRPTPPGRSRPIVIDSTGSFRIDSILPGRYYFVVRALGYAPDTIVLKLGAGDSLVRFVTLPRRCVYDSLTARRDIRERHPRILLHGSLAPVALSEAEVAAEHKYRFTYQEFGDEIVDPIECDEEYNRVVIGYLDRTYGRTWRDSVRTR